jgi:hypothetical protein
MLLFRTVRNDRLFDTVDLNQVPPCFKIKTEYSLVFLDPLFLSLAWGIRFRGIYDDQC